LYKETPCLIPAIAASASVIGSIFPSLGVVDNRPNHTRHAYQHNASGLYQDALNAL
jgi:hypothetical protein